MFRPKNLGPLNFPNKLVQKNQRQNEFLAQKDCWFKKIVGPKNIWVKIGLIKKMWSTKMKAPKN